MLIVLIAKYRYILGVYTEEIRTIFKIHINSAVYEYYML